MYLITTNKGLHASFESNRLKLLDYDKKSIYTNGEGLRFIRKVSPDTYIVGGQEELIIVKASNKFELMGNIKLPGLVDIKDICIGDSFIAILSGLRDSVYILSKDLNNIIVCFNINKEGKLEFFKDRQVQCQEIPSSFFQIFYVPGLNNFHEFNRLKLLSNGELSIISDIQHKYCSIDLTNNFSYHIISQDQRSFDVGQGGIPWDANFFNDKNKIPIDEIISNGIKC
jgi:hypothetical protein